MSWRWRVVMKRVASAEPFYPTASHRRWAVYREPRRSCRRGSRRFGPVLPGLPRDAASTTRGRGALVESARVSSETFREALSGSIWALAGRQTPGDASAALNTKEHLVDSGEWDTGRAEIRRESDAAAPPDREGSDVVWRQRPTTLPASGARREGDGRPTLTRPRSSYIYDRRWSDPKGARQT